MVYMYIHVCMCGHMWYLYMYVWYMYTRIQYTVLRTVVSGKTIFLQIRMPLQQFLHVFKPYLRYGECFCRVKSSVHSLEVAFVVMETL